MIHFCSVGDYCKTLLGVKRSTNNSMVHADLGRLTLRTFIVINMIKNCCKLLNSDNCILRDCYLHYMYESVESYVHGNPPSETDSTRSPKTSS